MDTGIGKAILEHVKKHFEVCNNIFSKMTKSELEKELEIQNEFLVRAKNEDNDKAIQMITEDIEQIKSAKR